MMPDTTSNETPADLVNASQLALATSREVAKANSDPPALLQHDAGTLANAPAANAVADQDPEFSPGARQRDYRESSAVDPPQRDCDLASHRGALRLVSLPGRYRLCRHRH